MGMNKGNGYWGKELRVDLTKGEIIKKDIPESLMKKVIGGAGYGAEVMLYEVPVEVKPYDPENKLIFATGPFQSGNSTGSAKFSVVSKSPLTGIYADSAGGGKWGVGFKKTGYDSIVFEGKSDKPVYLWINDDEVELRDASQFWGLDTYETTDALKEELDDKKISVACIGQAGERKVAIASIVMDKHSFVGRCGLGAIMGSKMLKAIVVKGTKTCSVYDKEKLQELSRKIGKAVYEAQKEELRMHGTAAVVVGTEAAGDMPIKYWSGDVWPEGAEKIGAPNYTDVLQAKSWSCSNCTIGCHRTVNVEEPDKYKLKGAGPEYETLGMLGGNLLIDDVKAIAKGNELCNRYGMDTISAGAFVGFTMECFEKGLMNTSEIEEFSITWGDKDKMIEMMHMIGNREGYFGNLFCDGIIPAAKKLGEEAEKFAMHVKGLDIPAHDPRAYHSLAINYATGSRGGCHERGNPQVASMGVLLKDAGITEDVDRFEMKNSSFVAAKYQDYGVLTNCLVHCKFMLFGGMNLQELLDIFNATTGWEWSMEEFLEAGERIFTLQRMVNVKYGITRTDDKLPDRMFEAAKEGSRAGKAPTKNLFEKELDNYYLIRGWDNKGVPTRETLKRFEMQLLFEGE